MKIKERLVDSVIILIMGILLVNLFVCKGGRESVTDDAAQDAALRFEQNWLYSDAQEQGREVGFPFSVPKSEVPGQAVLTSTLPAVRDGEYLILFKQQQGIKAYVEDECIFQSPVNERDGEPDMLGSRLLYIPLRNEYSGKAIRLELYPVQSLRDYEIEHLYICTISEFELNYLRNNWGEVLTFLVTVMLGVALLIAYIWQSVRRSAYDYSIFLHLGIFAIIGGIWMSTDSVLLQVLTQNPRVCAVISFCTFMLMPVPMLAFSYSIIERRYPVLLYLEIVLCLNCILQMIMKLTGVNTFPNMLVFTHILLMTAILTVLGVMIRARRLERTYYVNGKIVAIWVLAVFGLVALLCYYVSQVQYLPIIQTGMLSFLLILIWLTIHRGMHYFKDRTEEDLYRVIAYQDVMTELGNRRAFEEQLRELQQCTAMKDLAIVEFDVNNLKEANDQFGHRMGDELLKATAACIKTVFAEKAKLYRIGGDEFVVMVNEPEPELQADLQAFDRCVAEYDRSLASGLAVAKGYAYAQDGANEELEDVLRRADHLMYQTKNEMKAAQRQSPQG